MSIQVLVVGYTIYGITFSVLNYGDLEYMFIQL